MEGQSSENEQEASLELYKTQLSQVDQAIQAAGATDDLTKLKADLEELIKLTQDNLLEIKKAKLLKMLGPMDDDGDDDEKEVASTVVTNSTTIVDDDDDDEYAAFQRAVGESSSSGNHTESIPYPSHSHQKSDEEEEDDSGMQESLLHLVGTKCRAPFSQDWGGMHYGNAMVLSIGDIEGVDSIDECTVQVIAINPTYQSMVPCKYFLDGKCRFSSKDCRSSHGFSVKISELQSYLEPDYSKLKEGCRCLARQDYDEVWYQGMVIEVSSDSELKVLFDATKEEEIIRVEHVVPILEEDKDSSDEDSDSDYHKLNKTEEEEDSEAPIYLWKPAQTTEKLGAWETHTKGIGSKLMAKMGYVAGQGLGPRGDGRAEPVPILLLPAGKSLDKIMQLKEMSGNADMFNAMKKLEKRQKLMEKKGAEKEYGKVVPKWGVFGFLNQHLSPGKKGGCRKSSKQESTSSLSEAKQSSAKDLTKRSDSEVNIQIFKTAEAIRAVERHLVHLRTQLSRNQDKDRKMADRIRQKIAEEENNLHKLKTSSQTLDTHKERRKAHKKLAIF